MKVIVQKFGGTSLKDSIRLKKVASWIVACKEKKQGVVVVVSAQGGTTDTLIKRAKEVTGNPRGRELDTLLSAGEQMSAALLSMAVEELGHRAISFTGAQINMKTTDEFNNARILEVDTKRIEESLKEGYVVIVCGFQGTDSRGDITTLGRGGSDTTAVALGAALKSECVEIYTDVDGIYSADPRIVSEARKISEISYKEMIEMAGKGARVLHTRSVEMAAKYNIKIHLRSSYTWEEGTWIREEKKMEKEQIRGITHMENLGKLSIKDLKDTVSLQRVIDIAEEEEMDIQEINQEITAAGRYEVSILLGDKDAVMLAKLVEREIKEAKVDIKSKLGMVSATGIGVRSNRIQGRVLRLIHSLNVNTQMISSSETSLSYVIAEKDIARVKVDMHRELIEK